MNNKIWPVVSLCTLSSTMSYAGGMDRSSLSISALFEKDSYMELSVVTVNPKVSGSLSNTSSGDITPKFFQFSGAYKQDLSAKLSMAVIIDQPYGADVEYPKGTNYPLAGSNASVDTTAITGVIRYKFTQPFSAHGGIRNMTSKGDVELPYATYKLNTDTQNDWGYLVGMAYEKSDIGLLASLTYHSPIKIRFNSTESISSSALTENSTFNTTMPQSLNFDFQTGLNKKTLLMFSARWAEWSESEITPQLYTTEVSPGKSLVDDKSNTISYRLGLGRRLTDTLSGSLSLGYEKPSNRVSSNLSPTDGYTSVLAGLKYNLSPQTAVAAGMSYIWIHDTYTNISGNDTDFKDNTAVGFGIKVSHTL